jgi:hypothetical protein
VHSEFPNADLQKVFANKIKRVQACIDARGHHFQHLLQVHSDFPNALYFAIIRPPISDLSRNVHLTIPVSRDVTREGTSLYRTHGILQLGGIRVYTFPYEVLPVVTPQTVFSRKSPTKILVSTFCNTAVPPYPLIQYPRFTAARKKIKS